MKIPPYGLHGGQTGSPNRASLDSGGETIALGSKESPRQLRPGDTITLVSSGGGGWGNPYTRRPDLVMQDVVNGIISVEAARSVYGVAIGPDGISLEETERLRRKRI